MRDPYSRTAAEEPRPISPIPAAEERQGQRPHRQASSSLASPASPTPLRRPTTGLNGPDLQGPGAGTIAAYGQEAPGIRAPPGGSGSSEGAFPRTPSRPPTQHLGVPQTTVFGTRNGPASRDRKH